MSIQTDRQSDRQTYDTVHIVVWLTRSWHTLSEWRENVGLWDWIKDGDKTSVNTGHDACSLDTELEICRHWQTDTQTDRQTHTYTLTNG